MQAPDWAALDAAWLPARKAGVVGSATTEQIIAHAAGYLPAACRVLDEFAGADLGTGAGVPGVVLAALRPASTWTLVDGNERRCEFARTAVRALGLGPRVDVVHIRAEELGHLPAHRASYDLVVARSFGPVDELAECALPLLNDTGTLSVSIVEETRQRWIHGADALELTLTEQEGPEDARFLLVQMKSTVPDAWPRRPATRRRSPLL